MPYLVGKANLFCSKVDSSIAAVRSFTIRGIVVTDVRSFWYNELIVRTFQIAKYHNKHKKELI